MIIIPELPEVETIKRIIEPQIHGLMIDKVDVKRPEVMAYPAADEFCGLLTGQTISCMTRWGKFLVIQLISNDRIILHLRMTGCLLITSANSLNMGEWERLAASRYSYQYPIADIDSKIQSEFTQDLITYMPKIIIVQDYESSNSVNLFVTSDSYELLYVANDTTAIYRIKEDTASSSH